MQEALLQLLRLAKGALGFSALALTRGRPGLASSNLKCTGTDTKMSVDPLLERSL